MNKLGMNKLSYSVHLVRRILKKLKIATSATNDKQLLDKFENYINYNENILNTHATTTINTFQKNKQQFRLSKLYIEHRYTMGSQIFPVPF